MIKGEKALKLVPLWVRLIGPESARKRLILRDIGVSTAVKIVGNTYESTPKDLVANILLGEMAKDGITFDDGIAS